MIDATHLSDVLPKHLTESSYQELREAVKRFPEIAYDRFYSSYNIDERTIYQGDCIASLPFVRLGKIIDKAKCFVLSNTCDMDISSNKRYFKSQVVFSPIVDPEPYIQALKAKKKGSEAIDTEEAIDAHFASIRKQESSQIMYLPPCAKLQNGGLVFLDQVYHVPSESIPRDTLESFRLLTLSNYGHYCMCIKLSHHFCRVTAETDNPSAAPTS